MASKSKSAADRQTIVDKLCKLLKKEFGSSPKREQLPVLETMLYALCLENSSHENAQVAFDRLKNDFFDWNEVRVSTIAELEPVFEGLSDAAHRAMRIRYILYYVFDHQYSYDFEGIKKKTLELAQKQLVKIKHLTPYARNYLLQRCLGNHVIPADDQIVTVSTWLGLLPEGTGPEAAGDTLKAYVRKSDGIDFAWMLKALASSKYARPLLEDLDVCYDEESCDIASAEARLKDLFSGKIARSHAAKKAAETRRAAAEAEKAAAAKKAKAARAAEKAKTDKPAEPSKGEKPESENAAVKPKTEKPKTEKLVEKPKTEKPVEKAKADAPTESAVAVKKKISKPAAAKTDETAAKPADGTKSKAADPAKTKTARPVASEKSDSSEGSVKKTATAKPTTAGKKTTKPDVKKKTTTRKKS